MEYMDIRFPNLGIVFSNVGRYISIGDFPIMFYGIIIASGFLVGLLVAQREAKRTGQNPELYLDYLICMMIPAIIGALIMELGQFGSADMTVGLGFSYVFGMIIAAVVGSLAIRACLRLVHNGKFRFFAYYCFIVGIIALVANFA